MIKQWNGAVWKITMTKNFLRVERFSQSGKSDFPYSIVEVDPCQIIANPAYDPTSGTTRNNRIENQNRSGHIMVASVLDLWTLILDVIRNGEDV